MEGMEWNGTSDRNGLEWNGRVHAGLATRASTAFDICSFYRPGLPHPAGSNTQPHRIATPAAVRDRLPPIRRSPGYSPPLRRPPGSSSAAAPRSPT